MTDGIGWDGMQQCRANVKSRVVNARIVAIATTNFLSMDVSNKSMNNTDEKLENYEFVPPESDDFQYEEVSLEDDWSFAEGEEDLKATVRAIQYRAESDATAAQTQTTYQPEAVDNFLRNFLSQMGMSETLECFQTEWTELVRKGLIDPDQVGVVPDVYVENARVNSELRNTHREREEYSLAAGAAAETLVRVQRARDAHRLQHKRVVQEKNHLIEQIRKLKVQCSSYDSALTRMSGKYEAVLKQKALVTLERDKVMEQSKRQPTFCGNADEEEAMKRSTATEEPCVKGTASPVIQPRPPSTPSNTTGNRSRWRPKETKQSTG
ncbi:uncharacterized protein V6R79_024939 [Siganus canaliculatus]